MQRKALLGSLLTVGVVIALVAGAFSAATWQDSRTGTIEVEAGTVAIALDGEDEAPSVPFTLDTASCAADDNLAPDSSCDFEITVSNAGTLDFNLSLGAITHAGAVGSDTNNCFSAVWAPAPQTATPYSPAEPSTGTMTVTVSNDEDCNGASGAFTVLFTATYAPA